MIPQTVFIWSLPRLESKRKFFPFFLGFRWSSYFVKFCFVCVCLWTQESKQKVWWHCWNSSFSFWFFPPPSLLSFGFFVPYVFCLYSLRLTFFLWIEGVSTCHFYALCLNTYILSMFPEYTNSMTKMIGLIIQHFRASRLLPGSFRKEFLLTTFSRAVITRQLVI